MGPFMTQKIVGVTFFTDYWARNIFLVEIQYVSSPETGF